MGDRTGELRRSTENRRALFARWYSLGLPSWRAYELAGFRGHRQSLYANAARFLADPRTQALVEQEQLRRLEVSSDVLGAALRRASAATTAAIASGRFGVAFRLIRQLEALDRDLVTPDELEDHPGVQDLGDLHERAHTR